MNELRNDPAPLAPARRRSSGRQARLVIAVVTGVIGVGVGMAVAGVGTTGAARLAAQETLAPGTVQPGPAPTVDPLAVSAHTLMMQKCTPCHAGANPRNAVSVEQWDSLIASGSVKPGDAAHSSFVTMVQKGFMPPSSTARLTPAQADLFARWVNAGAKDWETITVAQRVHNLFDMKCVRCHNAQRPAAGINLSSHAGVLAANILNPKDPLHSRLLQSVISGEMPRGGQKLTTPEMQTLDAWMKVGTPDWVAPVTPPVQKS